MTARPTVHDLLRLSEEQLADLSARAGAEGACWVAESLARAPWVVVRRARTRDGVPVGVRGPVRHQRWAGVLGTAPVLVRRPADLADASAPRPWLAPIRAMHDLSRHLPDILPTTLTAGPGGSCGFEVATGAATMTPTSDLDLVVHAPTQLRVDQVQALAMAVRAASERSGCRIDTLVETPLGGVHLDDLLPGRHLVLRTPDGPTPCSSPWPTPGEAA